MANAYVRGRMLGLSSGCGASRKTAGIPGWQKLRAFTEGM